MSFQFQIERYFDYLLPSIFVVVSSLLLIVSTLAFWFFVPFVVVAYFWCKYHFWVFLVGSAVLYFAAYFMSAETVSLFNVAFNLLIVGALLGVAWFGEMTSATLKKETLVNSKAISILQKIKAEYYVYVIIAIFALVIGAYFGALKASPLGDDAFLHVGKALFIRNNFPNINWYPNWYLGLDMFQTYPPLYYFIVALANFVTSIPITELIVGFFFFAMFLLGVAVYKLSKGMGLPTYLSLGFSLAWLSLPIVWGETITGGAYLRSFAIPFYILSIVVAYSHVKSINNAKPGKKALLSLVFFLSFAALLHEMIGFFAVATVFLVYLLAVRGFKRKLKTILMVFVPVVGLISWWYLPLVSHQFSYPSFAPNDLILTSFQGLSVSLTPILLPLLLFLCSLSVFALIKNKQIFDISYEKKALLVIFAILSLYFVVFACFPMPANFYLMAAYDYAIWFGISLTLFIITLSSVLNAHFGIMTSNKLKHGLSSFPAVSSIILILLIALSFMVSLPTVYPSNVNPDNPNDWVHGLGQDLSYINHISPDNFRLSAITRRVYAMNQYTNPDLIFTGGRQLGSNHEYYDDIFAERVLLRYHEDVTLYSDAALGAHSTVAYSMANYYSSMFWMDWYATNDILAASFEQTLPTIQGYYERPQFYNNISLSDGSSFITYNGSSSILVSTNAPVVGVIDNDTTYNALIQTLGELDINSQTIIPVKLETANLQQDLQFINTVFVSSDQFQTYQTVLETFARNGGNVVVMDYNPESMTFVNASLTQSGVTFSTYALPLPNPDDSSQIVATTNQGDIISRSPLGGGFITRSSVSLEELYQDASPEASAVLAAILLPNFNITAYKPGNIDLNSTVNAIGNVANFNNQETLEGKTSWNGQVTYAIPFEKQISTSNVSLMQFEMWSEGQPINIALDLVNSTSNASLTYNLPYSSWTGWKTFSIPLASFIATKSNSTLSQFNKINLVLRNGESSLTGEENYTLKIQNLYVHEITSNSTCTPLTFNWKQPNLLQAAIESSSTSPTTRLLWKETYDSNWQITIDPQSTNITSFYAGPGVMLICIPSNVSSIQFFMPLSQIQDIGLAVSIITFIVLVIIITQQKRLSKLFSFKH